MAKKTETKKQNHDKLAVLLGVVGVVLGAIALLIALWTVQQMYIRDDQQVRSVLQRNYDDARQRFCYNNEIRPCDDIAVTEWNEENPDNTFTLRRPY